MKKTRIEEEREPAPTTCANTMLIRDDTSCMRDESDQDTICDEDLYDFVFTCLGETPETHPITSTQRIILSQKSHGKRINLNWILLDSQSTINIFNNKRLLKYIRKCEENETVQ